ncbi:hypothetical protein BSGG_5235 [Bacteroides sp. D2]|nr:hypothetical protein BSGG_5235 [Bacteroides sp. D2]
MKNLKYLTLTLFSGLCMGAIFINSGLLTDSPIFPKRLLVFARLRITRLCLSYLLLTGKNVSVMSRI